ncbi:MAG: 50S ribosomal protein L6 [Candidatus Bilamarchaeaceae archaeon]
MITIPDGITFEIKDDKITVKGPKGNVTKKFPKTLKVEKNGNSLNIISLSKKDDALVGTYDSILKSMIEGVTNGYTKKLKAIYAHFPISFEVKGSNIIIKNFLGEKNPRLSKIVGDGTKVEVKGTQLTISGPDKEAIGQTIANLKAALKIREKDPRVFQDGVYEVVE